MRKAVLSTCRASRAMSSRCAIARRRRSGCATKIEKLKGAWREAIEAFEQEKLSRAVTAALRYIGECRLLRLQHSNAQQLYELAKMQREAAEADRAEAAAALQRSAEENRRLTRENRRLRAELAGEDEWAEEKLARDLEWCEQYLGSQNPSEESAQASVRDAAWDEEAAEAEQAAHSERRQSRATMPPPPPRATVVPLSCVGGHQNVVRAWRV
mmetsp:Transcript_34497/g.90757  ORF Transcript_34497/g.90757 Transcript_34497/m.90757 type:complete len:213 (-) Transcript_34497:92-730(-)